MNAFNDSCMIADGASDRILIEENHLRPEMSRYNLYDNNFSKYCYELTCESKLWRFHVRIVSITLVNKQFITTWLA